MLISKITISKTRKLNQIFSVVSRRMLVINPGLKDIENLRGIKCYDWSEKNYHISGTLGKVITSGLIELGWIKKSLTNREVGITENGKLNLYKYFGIEF
jgi:hypothetical protein